MCPRFGVMRLGTFPAVTFCHSLGLVPSVVGAVNVAGSSSSLVGAPLIHWVLGVSVHRGRCPTETPQVQPAMKINTVAPQTKRYFPAHCGTAAMMGYEHPDHGLCR